MLTVLLSLKIIIKWIKYQISLNTVYAIQYFTCWSMEKSMYSWCEKQNLAIAKHDCIKFPNLDISHANKEGT